MDTIRQAIVKHLLNQPYQTDLLRNIQHDLGYPRLEYGNVPETNPVNRVLVQMRDDGTVSIPAQQWGDARVTLQDMSEYQPY